MSAEARRLAYLNALGVDLFEPRTAPDRHEPANDIADDVVNEPASDPMASREAATSESASETPEWSELRLAVAGCTRCPLHEGRTQTVFGVGNRAAEWMIVGEAPGAEEDRRGEPFVGRAGKLLDEMLRAVGLDRSSVFIANILKCRPPNNRDPAAAEAEACRDYLDRQIELVQPKLILAVGRIAAQQLLGSGENVGRMRGQVHSLGKQGIPVVVTYHPAYLLRSPAQKRAAWKDLCLARQVARAPAA